MRLKKKDIILILSLLAAAGILYLLISLMPQKEGTCAVARVDGKEVGRWRLAEDTEADIDTAFGHNRLVISNGTAHMKEADCPDGYCILQGEIGKNGGQIICLPHHLVIAVEGGSEDAPGIDTVAK